MALPSSRDEFKEYCLRQLGKPVVDINVSDDQVNDRVEDAIQYWQEYHFWGSRRVYLAHQITADDKVNKYLPIGDDILSVIRIFQTSSLQTASSLFNVEYNVAFREVFNGTSSQMTNYYMAMQNLEMIGDLLTGEKPIRFNPYEDKVHIDMNWEKVSTGQYILMEAHKRTTPDDYPAMWGDRWLRRYATQLVKRQWGDNLKKYEGIQMIGGVIFNGQTIYNEAEDAIAQLEGEMASGFQRPPEDLIG